MNNYTFVSKLNIKRWTVVLLAVIIVASVFALASCDYIFVSLKSISAEYNGGDAEVGGAINVNDVKVTAHYSNKTSKQVSKFELSYDFSSAGLRTVAVSYEHGGKSYDTTFTVNVVEKTVPPEPQPIVLASIAAAYNGQKVKVNGVINKNDITVTAHYSNNTDKTVSDYDLLYDFSSSGQKTVTVTYSENGVTKTCEFTVEVIADEPIPPTPDVSLENITATYNGSNIKIGANLNNDDIEVTAYYSDGSSKAVTNFSVGGFSSAKAGTCVVTVSYTENNITKESTVSITVIDDSQSVVTESNLSIHFLEFENQSSGDCIYIKAGDTDILIDAGSTDGSAQTIDKYIKEYCTDGVLEYVIATHAHTDHISAFVGTDSTPGIMDRYKCETIIKYAQAGTTSQMRAKFEAKCETQVANGANLYTALDCINNANGAEKIYNLTDDGSITMEVLDQKYYATKSSDENNHSVCVMISQGDNHYLFTGDLEEGGEKSLVELNPDLPEMVLFKGGHHGSYTASNEVLLAKIKPQYVCICCCAGNVEYLKQAPQNLSHSFPAQEMIDRVAKYTDRVYVTTLGFIKWDESKNKYFNDGYTSMNGNIVFSCINGEITLNCSNNNLKLKDTDWFKENRICPKEWLSSESA